MIESSNHFVGIFIEFFYNTFEHELFCISEVFFMDITKMSDQEIIDYLKSRGSSNRVVGLARSKTIEEFFQEHMLGF